MKGFLPDSCFRATVAAIFGTDGRVTDGRMRGEERLISMESDTTRLSWTETTLCRQLCLLSPFSLTLFGHLLHHLFWSHFRVNGFKVSDRQIFISRTKTSISRPRERQKRFESSEAVGKIRGLGSFVTNSYDPCSSFLLTGFLPVSGIISGLWTIG